MQATLSISSARFAGPSMVGLDASANRPVTALDSSLDSDQLLRGQKTVAIVHNGTTYRLQATKLGKLILTK